jgi:hypothetical protein
MVYVFAGLEQLYHTMGRISFLEAWYLMIKEMPKYITLLEMKLEHGLLLSVCSWVNIMTIYF